ncbi:hypothetical protein [Rahnella sp. AN3-3W3]|uniref:hypothetical protein n=1 Tax=Rahnella sp. AN3-3W3 TaxID=1610578 RepID=UPI000DD41BD5|nr:hypothetical protein [Rahnella sp. AN3-3W3]
MSHTDVIAFRERLTTLVRTLQIAPQVAENQVLDRMALSFRKLLNFFAEDDARTQQAFLLPPQAGETQRLLCELMAENLAISQEHKLFREDISAVLMAQCFTGILVQLAQTPGDPQTRHQNSLGCAKLFCEGVWLGKL